MSKTNDYIGFIDSKEQLENERKPKMCKKAKIGYKELIESRIKHFKKYVAKKDCTDRNKEIGSHIVFELNTILYMVEGNLKTKKGNK
tara:strand:+ start:15 stop:275 length:261 start_codon:yes stop_codon:yes gene_type:complete